MNRDDAYNLVLAAYKKATKNDTENLSEQTDLIEEGIIDSLDTMTILFEIDDAVDGKLGVGDDYNGFKISQLVDLVLASEGS
jgi:acyl carrier protein